MLPLSTQDKAALFAQAQRLHAAGQRLQARKAFEQLILSDPDHAAAHAFLSTLAYEDGDADGFLHHTARALDLAPGSQRLLQAAADRYGRTGHADKALDAYDRLIALDPKAIAPRADKARYLQTLGRFDDAEEMLRKLIKRHPNQPELYRILLGGIRTRKGDPLVRQMVKLWNDPRLNDAGRVHLGFALAKALEEQGETGKVFAFLNRANALQAKIAPLDPQAKDREIAAVLAAQDSDLTPIDGCMDPRPVFVTGMPRSGTTLVEQIIAAHGQAHAGGEMVHALRQAYAHFGAVEKIKPLAQISPAALADYADHYRRLAMRDTGAKSGVITDKAIQSYLIFGLIHRAMPGARIIVVHRDPRDIALSIYKNHFAIGTHRYANDLAEIAHEIKRFRKVVQHWKDRMHGVIQEVHYEALVSDPEPQSRALIAAAGLEWEDQCLDFHQSRAAVQTLSLAQVRQPIHAGRRDAWRRYETELQPFIHAWGTDPWD
ncbi:tetratricopeptide repeat-containing sulfotransferase family protein [Tropicibacter oceani]|uniref:Sulfotransferase n=1 Tax=Tropicibacter oceani TaxID=3058420 RepID=A0ABY8QK63_9RHOB|nr:tetratricopeptide repeat-containing sulfotransferase family protein [Tropicibacter oceani]WGW04999.1 sulfotransferase [Tropicibacter oceani]